MNKALLHRLATIERNQPEETFFTLCKRWRDVSESRKSIAEKMDVPFVAAEYACTLGLQYGKPEDARFPFAKWTTEEIKYFLKLAGDKE